MMKLRKSLFLLPLLASFALVGCNASGGDGDGDGGDGGDTSGENLPYSAAQSQEKIRQLAEGDGLEITFVSTDNGEEDDPMTLGAKDQKVWLFDGDDKSGYAYTEDSLTLYRYEDGEYVATPVPLDEGDDPEAVYDEFIDTYSVLFCFASVYDGGYGFEKVKDTTFLGRSATEYKYSVTTFGVHVEWKAVIDKGTGITLYWGAYGSAGGETGSASYEVTEFKTGSQVVAPF